MGSPLEIAGRSIGLGATCFVIADAGLSHNGELDLALRLADTAGMAGVGVAKFRTRITGEPAVSDALFAASSTTSMRMSSCAPTGLIGTERASSDRFFMFWRLGE